MRGGGKADKLNAKVEDDEWVVVALICIWLNALPTELEFNSYLANLKNLL